MGIVIRKAGLPPLFSFFCVFFLCPFSLSSFLFDEVTGVRRDITQTQSSMGTVNFGSSAETSVLFLVWAFALDCCHTQLQNKWSEVCSVIFTSHQIASPPRSAQISFCAR